MTSELETATSTSAPAALTLSEAWDVEARHVGCYTGGKIHLSQQTGLLCCLCKEELCIVDVDRGSEMRRAAQEGDGVLTFAVDPTGASVATSHRSGLVRHWQLGAESTPPTMLRSWRAHEQLVSDMCFDASGGFIATGSIDRTAKVFDASGYFCTHNFRGHIAIVNMLRFHPSRLQLVTIAEAEVRVWDLAKSKCIAVLKDHLSSISGMTFGKVKNGIFHLVTAGRDQVINVWGLEDVPKLARSIPAFEALEGVAVASVKSLKMSGDTIPWLSEKGSVPAYVIVTVGGKGVLKVWNPVTGVKLHERQSPHAANGAFRQVFCVEGPDGPRLLTAGEDMNIVFWSLPDFSIINYVMGHNEEIVHVQFLPKWSMQQDPSDSSKQTMAASASKFVCITNDEHPRIIDCQDFSTMLLMGHTDMVIACDVSADGKWIATGGKDQTIWIWDAEEGHGVCTLRGHAGSVSALSFPKKRPKTISKEGSGPLTLVSGSQDKTMKVWEIPAPSSGAEEAFVVEKAKVTVVAHSKEVNDVVIAPNNKLIASAGQDKLVYIWGFPKGNKLGELSGHRRAVWNVAFSPVDQVVASASGDGTIRLWSLKDYAAIRAFQGHSGAVLRVCFLANGMQLMSSSADGLLKLWHIRTADCAATLEEHGGKVWCIDVLGNRMVSGGTDSKLCIWRDSTSERAKERHEAHAEEVLKDSKIGTLLQQGKVEAALTLALDLGRSGQMRNILINHGTDLIGDVFADGSEDAGHEVKNRGRSENKAVDLQRWVASLGVEQLSKLLELLEQWNANRKTAAIAQLLMSLVLAAVPPERLGEVEGMNATCAAILSYTTRHLSRVESLLQKTFLFDLVLQSSGQGLPLQDADSGVSLAVKRSHNGGVERPSAEDALKRTMEVLLGPKGDDDDDLHDDKEFQGAATGDADATPEESQEAAEAAPPPKKKRKAVKVRKVGAVS
mmetsp:Transcript_64419/g.153674  ORF Transcript_64419/g.153674 Transcript_64419/m.153674 type:complete len:951 (-) Transcript_64419:63-2915(-)